MEEKSEEFGAESVGIREEELPIGGPVDGKGYGGEEPPERVR